MSVLMGIFREVVQLIGDGISTFEGLLDQLISKIPGVNDPPADEVKTAVEMSLRRALGLASDLNFILMSDDGQYEFNQLVPHSPELDNLTPDQLRIIRNSLLNDRADAEFLRRLFNSASGGGSDSEEEGEDAATAAAAAALNSEIFNSVPGLTELTCFSYAPPSADKAADGAKKVLKKRRADFLHFSSIMMASSDPVVGPILDGVINSTVNASEAAREAQ